MLAGGQPCTHQAYIGWVQSDRLALDGRAPAWVPHLAHHHETCAATSIGEVEDAIAGTHDRQFVIAGGTREWLGTVRTLDDGDSFGRARRKLGLRRRGVRHG